MVSSVFQYGSIQSVTITVNIRSFQTVSISAESKAEHSGNHYHWPVSAHHPLRSAPLYRSSRRVKVLDATSGEPSGKVSESADASASFKSDVSKHFGFSASRNENKGLKVTGRTETICRRWRRSATLSTPAVESTPRCRSPRLKTGRLNRTFR